MARVAFIGLGNMGGGMAANLVKAGHEVVAFDLVEAALAKAGTRDAVMLGDTPWDVEAARRAGVETVCVMTGGFSEQELREAGAVAVFESVLELRERLDETPLGRRG